MGQVYDPWVYLGYIPAQTRRIHLATGSIVLPLRHPLHTAKADASVNALTGGRLILGIASGARLVEYQAFGVDCHTRGERFRDAFDFLNRALYESFPRIDSLLGRLNGVDLVPKPTTGRIPMLVTGHSQQPLEWIGARADGGLYYPRDPAHQAARLGEWQRLCANNGVDLAEAVDTPPSRIHLGYRLGRSALIELLGGLRNLGVNHVTFNLKYGDGHDST